MGGVVVLLCWSGVGGVGWTDLSRRETTMGIDISY